MPSRRLRRLDALLCLHNFIVPPFGCHHAVNKGCGHLRRWGLISDFSEKMSVDHLWLLNELQELLYFSYASHPDVKNKSKIRTGDRSAWRGSGKQKRCRKDRMTGDENEWVVIWIPCNHNFAWAYEGINVESVQSLWQHCASVLR